MARDEPEGRLETVVFEAAGEPFTWLDVLLAADVRGEWAPFEEMLQRHSAGRDGDAEDVDLETALSAFRRRHGLLTAEEVEKWLERFDLDAVAWRRAVCRSVLRDRRNAEGRASRPATPGALLPLPFDTLWADAVVTGALQAWARRVAEDVALVAAGGGPTSPLASRDAAARRAWLVDVAEQVRAIEEGVVTLDAIRATLGSHALEWTRVSLEQVWFPAEAAAREALLCHRIEGETLANVAERSGGRRQELECRLEELEPELHARCVSGRPGQVLGPLPWESGFALVRIVDRRPPHPDDPKTLAHVRQHLLAALRQRAVWDHVRFVLPVTEAG